MLTTLICRLGGFHFDSIRRDVEHICEINFGGVNSYELKAFMFILGQTSQGWLDKQVNGIKLWDMFECILTNP